MPEIDLALRVLPADHQVFFARPGIQYRLYREVTEQKVVVPDLPALDLADGVPLDRQDRVMSRIHRARKLRGWHRSGRIADEPSRDLNDYDDVASGIRDAQFRGVVDGYFSKAKRGDMVLVVPSAFSDPAFIGEFAEDGDQYASFRAPSVYGDDPLVGRRVEWLAKIPKRELASDILDIVAKPNAFVLLPRSVRAGLYDLAYSAYSIEDSFTARLEVTDETFSSFDDLLIQAFINFVAANTQAVSEGKEVASFERGAFMESGDFTPDLRAEIHSPGFLSISSRKVTPLVAVVMLAAAIHIGPAAFAAAQDGTLRIGSASAPAGDACVAEVREQAIRQIQLLGLDRWAVACEKAKRAAQHTGLNGPTHVRP
ncbi:hypothetical protein D3273_13390 [Lichenibacterium minor]|uniref:Uncharacterized protein n=1 Tax=Lichenibacterium minor TaxID=2316528 RepID=A0A4Q2U695_9HYPH|nr:hypothetical protein [Lichenibacterium minor]RYC31378.1 hypothetical protein D3273_13390 [Lichenibacterium minor]